MKIEIFDSNLTKEDCKDVPFRKAIRGVIKKDGKYLVVHLKKYDITTFPGGGIEPGETYEDCVVREVLEETGIICTPREEKISVTEYFIDSVWTNVYFTCDFVEDTKKQSLTGKILETYYQIVMKFYQTISTDLSIHSKEKS